MTMDSYAALWSGGKDSCFACHRAISAGLKVTHLVNFADASLGRSLSHGIGAPVLACQVRAVGLPLVQRPVLKGSYEAVFKETMRELKAMGVAGLVTGDIDFNAHRVWLERVCGEAGLVLHMPLWGMTPWEIMNGLVAVGFRALIVSLQAKALGEEWLGSEMSKSFFEELRKLEQSNQVHPCGESGEYHTLVIDGPMFSRPLRIGRAERYQKDGRWFLDVKECSLA